MIVEHYTAGRFEAAIGIAAAATPEKTTPLGAYAAGRSLYERKRYHEAIPFLVRSLQPADLPGRDHALDTLARCLEQVERHAESIPHLRELVDRHADSPLRPAAVTRLAAALETTGNTAEAIRFYRLALQLQGSGERTGLRNSLARLVAAAGDTNAAVTASLEALAAEPYGTGNLEALERLETLLGSFTNQSVARRILLCRALLRADRDSQARELFGTIRGAAGADALETALLEAWILRRQKLHEQALPILQRALALPGLAPAGRARVLDNLFHTEISLKRPLPALAHADGRYRIAASGALPLYRSLIASVEAASSEAYRYTLHAARRFPDNTELAGLLLRHVARDLVYKRHQRAADRSRECLAVVKPEAKRAGFHYYLGVALQATGKNEAAALARRDAILAQPLGFYHHLIERDRLPVAAWTIPADTTLSRLCRAWFVTPPGQRTALENRIKAAWPRSSLSSLKSVDLDSAETGTALLPAAGVRRFTTFWKNGLFREAWRELGWRGIPERTDHPTRRRYWLAGLAGKAGHPRQQVLHLRRSLQAEGFGLEAALLERFFPGTIMRELYPRPYRALAENPGSRTPVPALLIEALMRQESAFDANAVSWAGAVGLMQLMPATAREIAERLKIEVNLFDPADNIRLGASYLAWVLSLYDDPAPGLAAYNAGPGRITRWRRQLIADHGSYRTDLFTELLPLAESRGYVKIVLSNLMIYEFLNR